MKICPACSRKIKRRKRGKCPECGVRLELLKHPEGGPTTLVLADADSPEVRQVQYTSQNDQMNTEGGLQISLGNEVPRVFLMGENKYKVIYQGVVHLKPVYCPSCEKLLYKNIVMDSGPNEQEIKCHKCKAVTSFIFDPRHKLDIRL